MLHSGGGIAGVKETGREGEHSKDHQTDSMMQVGGAGDAGQAHGPHTDTMVISGDS